MGACDESFLAADIIGLVVWVRGEYGKNGERGAGDQFDPMTWRNMESLSGRSQFPLGLRRTVIRGHAEGARHGDQELMAGLVRMTTPCDARLEVEKMEFPENLERDLLPDFRKCEGTSFVAT